MEGHHAAKWIAGELPLDYVSKDESITEVRLSFYDKKGILKRECFTGWPKSADRIIDVESRRPLVKPHLSDGNNFSGFFLVYLHLGALQGLV